MVREDLLSYVFLFLEANLKGHWAMAEKLSSVQRSPNKEATHFQSLGKQCFFETTTTGFWLCSCGSSGAPSGLADLDRRPSGPVSGLETIAGSF